VDKLASRDGRGLTDKFEFSLENQVGAVAASVLAFPFDIGRRQEAAAIHIPLGAGHHRWDLPMFNPVPVLNVDDSLA